MIENFEPTTPTEVMLLNEIKKLKIQLYEIAKIDPSYVLSSMGEPLEALRVNEFKDTITLRNSARLIASATPYGGLRVRLDVKYGKNQEFGSQYMLSEREKLNSNQAANLLMHLHKEQMHKIADFIRKPKRYTS